MLQLSIDLLLSNLKWYSVHLYIDLRDCWPLELPEPFSRFKRCFKKVTEPHPHLGKGAFTPESVIIMQKKLGDQIYGY